MMPLNLADIGEPQIIKRIGGSPDVKKHLEVKESRVAVSDELARKIMV